MAKSKGKFENFEGVARRSGYTVHIDMLRFKPEEDTRDRTDPRYLEHYQKVKEGILIYGGIEDEVRGYRGTIVEDGESHEVVFLTNGRTRYLAGLELITEGRFEELYYPLTLEEGNSLKHLASQYRTQQALPFTELETARLLERAIKVAGGNKEAVAEEFGISLDRLERLSKVADFMPQIKSLVKEGKVAVGTALDLVEETANNGDQSAAIAKLQRAVEHTGGKRVTKRDLLRIELEKADPREITQRRKTATSKIKSFAASSDVDLILLEEIAAKIDRANKLAQRQKEQDEAQGSGESSDD